MQALENSGAPQLWGGPFARAAYDFDKEGLNPPACPHKFGHGNMQVVAAYGNTDWRATWEFRRRSSGELNDLGVWGPLPGHEGLTRVGFTDQHSQLYVSTDGAEQFAALGSRRAGFQLETPAELWQVVDRPGWQSQGFSNMIGAGVVESPRLDAAGMPSAEGSRVLCVLTDDGGVFSTHLRGPQGAISSWRDVMWNLPRAGSQNDADGLGPAALAQRPFSSQSAMAYRLASDGVVEFVVGLSGDRVGHTALSRDHGITWSERPLRGLPLGEITSIVSTLDPTDDLIGVQAPKGALYVTVVGRGVYVLPPGEYVFVPTGSFCLPRPSLSADKAGEGFTELLEAGEYALPLGGALNTSGGNPPVVPHFSLDRIVLDEVVLPTFWAPPDGNGNGSGNGMKLTLQASFAQTHLSPLVHYERLNLQGVTPEAFFEPEMLAARQCLAASRLLHEHLTVPHHLAVVHDATTGAKAVYASLQPAGSPAYLSKANGRSTPTLELAYPFANDPAKAELVPSVRWPDVVSRSIVAAGVYQLWDTTTNAPQDPDAPPSAAVIWRQVAGLGVARGALQAKVVAGDNLSPAEAHDLNFPQGWKAVSGLAGGSHGRLAATVETVAVNRTQVSAAANNADFGLEFPSANLANAGVVFFQGGVYTFDDATTGQPRCRLELVHPQPATCAWVGKGEDERLVVGLNMYTVQERAADSGKTEATIAPANPFTAAIPVVYRKLDATAPIECPPGVVHATSMYFGLDEEALDQERWPVGLFILVPGTSTEAPAFPAGLTVSGNSIAPLLSLLELTSAQISPPLADQPCFGLATPAGFEPVLRSITHNLCCGPQRYFSARAGHQHLYIGRVGGGIKRLHLSLIPKFSA